MSRKIILGWRERVTLPDWGVRLVANIDTGSRFSSLDVRDLRVRGGVARFEIPVAYRSDQFMRVEAPVVGTLRGRGEGPEETTRAVVPVRLQIRGQEKTVEVHLRCPKVIGYRLRLGRRALAGNFLVDASQDPLSGEDADSGRES